MRWLVSLPGFLLQLAVDLPPELGQKVLQLHLDLVAVIGLRLRPGRVHKVEGTAASVVEHHLQLHLSLARRRYLLGWNGNRIYYTLHKERRKNPRMRPV